MDVGELREWVVFQQAPGTPDGRGGYVDTWSELFSDFANVQPLRPYERLQAQVLGGVMNYRLRIRYRDGVTAKLRAIWDGHTLEVAGPPVLVDGRREYLDLDCVERDSDG